MDLSAFIRRCLSQDDRIPMSRTKTGKLWVHIGPLRHPGYPVDFNTQHVNCRCVMPKRNS